MQLKKKNLIFLGAPGSGKGTISGMLTEIAPLAHISTGDILRDEVKRETELGKKAAVIMKQGGLVPDELVAGMVRSRLQCKDVENGFILDGFPRTLAQAKLLEQVFSDLGMQYDAAIFFNVPDAVLLERLTSRLTCRKCGAVYNRIGMKPQVEGICDKCGGELFQRPDDSMETAKARLSVFYAQTQPVIDFYRNGGKMIELSSGNKDESLSTLKTELC